MINLRGIANAAIQSINPNIPVSISVPNGYTIDPDTLIQIPAYTTLAAFGNVQALSSDDLKQIDGLNQEGILRAVYLYGNFNGVLRPDNQPTTVLTFSTNESGVTKDRSWNVFRVFEAWQTWCKVGVVLQTADEALP